MIILGALSIALTLICVVFKGDLKYEYMKFLLNSKNTNFYLEKVEDLELYQILIKNKYLPNIRYSTHSDMNEYRISEYTSEEAGIEAMEKIVIKHKSKFGRKVIVASTEIKKLDNKI